MFGSGMGSMMLGSGALGNDSLSLSLSSASY
jgi:hypothetical protein